MAQVHMGDYEVLSHLQTPECSLRLLKLSKGKFVNLHHHHKTTQIYFAVKGVAQVTVNDKVVTLQPHQILRVPPETLHDIRADGEAIVLSISIPPLYASDQYVATEHRKTQLK